MSAPRLPPGTVLAGKYTVGTCLGACGPTATYHAAMIGGRDVAVKVFDPQIRQRADVMPRLEQTYAATNALPHDLVAPILDAGYDAATGAPFSVTARIAVPSLAQFVAQRAMTPEEVVGLLNSMGRSLDLAHQRQFFHHALKPTNVFVDIQRGFSAVLTDFGAGLARDARPDQESRAESAPWLSPEQAQNAASGAGADVFAAALLAFFALTGKPYWLACQPQAGKRGTTDIAGWQRELLSPRTPPSARALQLGVTLNPAFDAVLGRALMLDTRERYPTVGELGLALENLVGTRGPDNAVTMAFPAGEFQGLEIGRADYPPAPSPMSPGMQPAARTPPPPPRPPGPPQQQGYMATPMHQPPPFAQPMQHGMAPPPPPTSYPGYGAPPNDPNVPAAASSYAGVAAQPRDPAAFATQASISPRGDASETRAPASTRFAAVLVVLVALIVLGGGAAAVIVMGKKTPTSTTDKATATGAPTTTAAASTSATATPSAASTDAPVATSDTSTPPAGPPPGQLVVTCVPGCDAISIDDQPVADPSKPIDVPPGKHTLIASKDGFNQKTDTLVIESGKKLSKSYTLSKQAAVATGPAPGPKPGPTPVPGGNTAPKNCGKFLKRCN